MSEEKNRFDPLRLPFLGYGRNKRDKKYVGFNRRMLAATIDSLALIFAMPLINRFFPIDREAYFKYAPDASDPANAERALLAMINDPAFIQSWAQNTVAQAVVMCIFCAICWQFWSATPGMIILRMKVVDAKTEGRINSLQVVLRSVGLLISGMCFFLGFLWISFDKKHRGWHDFLAGTVVVNIPWRKKTPDETPPEKVIAP